MLEDKYGKTYPKKDRKRQKKTKKDKKKVKEQNLGKAINTNIRGLNNVSSLTY